MYICCACKCSIKGTKSFFEFSEIIYREILLKTLTPILTPNIKTTNTSATNNICTQGNDTSVSWSQLVDETENEVSPPVTGKKTKGYFCSDTVFNLSRKVLNEIENKFLQKGLAFVPTPNIISEEDLRRDFGEFSVNGISGINHYLISVRSLLFDLNIIEKHHLNILV